MQVPRFTANMFRHEKIEDKRNACVYCAYVPTSPTIYTFLLNPPFFKYAAAALALVITSPVVASIANFDSRATTFSLLLLALLVCTRHTYCGVQNRNKHRISTFISYNEIQLFLMVTEQSNSVTGSFYRSISSPKHTITVNESCIKTI